MTFGIKHKLFLTIFITSTVIVLSMYLFMQWSFTRGFTDYVNRQELHALDNLTEALLEYYQQAGSWSEMLHNRHIWLKLQNESGPNKTPIPEKNIRSFQTPPHPEGLERHDSPFGPDNRTGPRDPFRMGPRTTLVAADGQTILIGRDVQDSNELTLRPLELNGKTIGYLGLVKPKGFTDDTDVYFVQQQTRVFGLIAASMILISMVLGLPLINHLLVPIKAMTKGAGQLTSGDYKIRIPVKTGDELGKLSKDFNLLAETLEHNEASRQRWMADISHELRTPLAVLRGEIEALQDGVRFADEQTLAALHHEILRLNRLVGDLHELSMSDLGALSYRKHRVDPVVILEQAIEVHSQRMAEQGITFNAELPENGILLIQADPHRLQQLFNNLLENSLRYTDPPGQIKVVMTQTGNELSLRFEDSEPGVAEEHLFRLFERLYRVENSRTRSQGGSGLGLAICKNIVEAHHGKIEAMPSSLGGLKVEVRLPLA